MATPLYVLVLLLVTLVSAQTLSSSCSLCLDLAGQAKRQGTETEDQTKQRILNAASSYSGDNKTEYINEVNCHWKKYYEDANQQQPQSLLSICADTGKCPIEYQTSPSSFILVDITNRTSNYGSTCTMPNIILLHHTVTPTADETINVLNQRGLSVQYIVALNGTVYQLVRDFHRAWHAGVGSWREIQNVNSYSAGIEIVNTGDQPFPQKQMDAVIALVAMLKSRWHVDEHYIIGHSDISPERKDDPSGYFPWQSLYNELSIFPDLFNSSLSHERQRSVIIGTNVTYTSEKLSKIQTDLVQLGYTHLTLPLGVYDNNTAYVFQAFNRHFSPEIFKKEATNPNTQETIHYESNTVVTCDKEEQEQILPVKEFLKNNDEIDGEALAGAKVLVSLSPLENANL
ncbi:N-acetylmuramoyl-L-alanine amidase [Ancylostoma duodenale]|uniref:N-acetylmuramoyl-L-alanine amidase n=1 Tax=Ancylostoma duodenale TaxID=51022 RepID=A0A0C2GUZ2_9BILA|nr:N-acetylmuramoyl-L-alanine amidase [Ancylostoma duodenale]